MNALVSYFKPEKFVTIRYQLVLLFINAAISVSLFYYATNYFKSSDIMPAIYPLTPQAAEKIGMTTKSIEVETGLYIENFNEFDLTNGNFIISASVWFKFDPAVTSLETIGKFSFEKGDLLNISKPDTKLINKLLFAEYRIKLKFTTNLNNRSFPVDDHSVFLTITNKFISPKEITFVASESGISLSPNMIINGWKLVKTGVTTGYTQALLERNDEQTIVYNPAVVYNLNFARSGMRQAFVLMLPIFLIFFLALISMSPDAKSSTMRVNLASFNISALIGYRFVIENMSPKVSYFMASDYIFNLLLALVFSIYFFNMATMTQENQTVRGVFLIAIHCIFLSSLYYILVYWAL